MPSDPRVYFASERTLLAWIRTGISILGVGFLVAKFGLFLRLMGHEGLLIGPQHASSLVGILFVLVGSGCMGLAAWQHLRFMKTLSEDDLPRSYSTSWSLGVAGLVAGLGLLLAFYLAATDHAVVAKPAAAPPVETRP